MVETNELDKSDCSVQERVTESLCLKRKILLKLKPKLDVDGLSIARTIVSNNTFEC